MTTYRLVLLGDPTSTEWLLRYDESKIILIDSDQQVVIEAAAADVHRLFDIYDLYSEDRITFVGQDSLITFKRDRSSALGIRTLVESALRSDQAYCTQLCRKYARKMWLGPTITIITSGLFALYCWWAFTFPDPPQGSWLHWLLRWFGWAIHLALLVLLGLALVGPFVFITGLRYWLRFRRIGRIIASNETQSDA